jgi:hypothetical protein
MDFDHEVYGSIPGREKIKNCYSNISNIFEYEYSISNKIKANIHPECA